MRKPIVIVGAGQAAARAAQALRQEGWQDRIVLVGDEPVPPYERPPLSKEVLAEGADPLKATIFAEPHYAAHGIELRLGTRAVRLDLAAPAVELAGGETLPFERLILATGSRPRLLPGTGPQPAGLYCLRTAEHARALAGALRPGASVVMIGGGFIGLEVAASATKLGCRATVIEARPQLMDRVVDPGVAAAYAAHHRGHGIDILLDASVAGIEGGTAVERVRLKDGRTIAADVVVLGIGARANDDLAATAGIACADGVLVDAAARSSDPRVLAVGDAARHRELGEQRLIRLESWENAELQGRAAAGTILGKPAQPAAPPWFWTDQFGWNLQIVGLRPPDAVVVQRGRFDDPSWCRFYLQNGRLAAACLLNSGRERRTVRELIATARPVSAEKLADTGRPLRTLLAEPV